MNDSSAKPSKIPKPTPKQLKFIRRYIKHGNASQASIGAGYSPKTAAANSSRMLKNEAVRSYITKLQEEIRADDKVIFGSIVNRTNDLALKCEKGELVTNSKGEPIIVRGKPVYKPDAANALKGLDLLSKQGGLYQPEAVNSMVVNHNALTVIHAPGAVEAWKKEREEEREDKE